MQKKNSRASAVQNHTVVATSGYRSSYAAFTCADLACSELIFAAKVRKVTKYRCDAYDPHLSRGCNNI